MQNMNNTVIWLDRNSTRTGKSRRQKTARSSHVHMARWAFHVSDLKAIIDTFNNTEHIESIPYDHNAMKLTINRGKTGK